MVAITATNSATPSLSASLSKAKLEQARREADQAEGAARSLRSQADAAEKDAQKSNSNVRKLASNAQQQENVTYARPRDAVADAVPIKTQEFLVSVYSATSQKRAENGNALKSDINAPPVLNGQRQATGRIVNVSA